MALRMRPKAACARRGRSPILSGGAVRLGRGPEKISGEGDGDDRTGGHQRFWADRPGFPAARPGIGDPASCVFGAGLTQAAGSLVKVFGWYDNEWGYTCRLADLAAIVGAQL